MKTYSRAFIYFITILLNACGGGSSSTQSAYSQPVSGETVNGVEVPPPPTAQLNATVLGADGNLNGVRDDVERVIAAQFGIEQNSQLIDLAKAYQSFLVLPTNDAASLQTQLQVILKKEDCINQNSSDLVTTSWVKFSTLNTNNRMQAFDDRVSVIPLDQVTTKCGS